MDVGERAPLVEGGEEEPEGGLTVDVEEDFKVDGAFVVTDVDELAFMVKRLIWWVRKSRIGRSCGQLLELRGAKNEGTVQRVEGGLKGVIA